MQIHGRNGKIGEPRPRNQIKTITHSLMNSVRFLSFSLTLVSSVLGIFLVIFPRSFLSFLLTTELQKHDDSLIAILLLLITRVAGGFCLVLCYATFVLLFILVAPSSHVTSMRANQNGNLNQQSENQKANNFPSQVVLTCYSSLGLIMIVVGLLNDRFVPVLPNSGQGHIRYEYLWGAGVFFLAMSCLGLMISLWPSQTNNREQIIGTNRNLGMRSSCCFCSGRRRTHVETENNNQSEITARNDNLTEPLLQQEEGTANGELQDDDTGNENSRIKGTRRLMKLAAPQMLYLYIGCAVLLIRLPFSLSIPHFISTTLGALARGDYQQAHTEIILLFLLGTVDAILDFWCVFLFGIAKEKIVRGVRVDLLAAILRQDISFFDHNTTGDLSSRLSSDCGEMAGDLTWFFRFSIESVVRIVGIAAYMLLRCPTLGGCALSIVPFVAVLNKLYGDWLCKNSIQVQTALAGANTVAQEAFACIRTVIAFAAEDLEHDKYVARINEHYRLNVKQLVMTGVYYMAISTFLINTVVQALLLLIGTHLIREGRLSSEILLAFMLYQGGLQNETMNLFNSYSSLIKSSGAGDKVFELLDRIPPLPGTGSREMVVAQPTNVRHEDGERSEQPLCTFSIRQAYFVYPSRPNHPVLKNLDLTIPGGSVTALVGSSGCGKSTIVSLLQRFYDPLSGDVFLDDRSLKSIDVKEHRRCIGVVTQDPVLFSGSILSNITYGCQSATIEDAIKSAKLANAHNFISSFPKGYSTEVGERGVQLSGGQKQRIAIARAVAKNPSLLLLDEATSALDADSETVVQEALDKLLTTTKMTTVIVAHRLRTVRNADCIVYLDQGQVIEKGTHDELMKIDGGFYRRMVSRSGTSGKLD